MEKVSKANSHGISKIYFRFKLSLFNKWPKSQAYYLVNYIL